MPGIASAPCRDMKRPFDIQDRSFLFATEIIDFCRPALPAGGVVRELARQLLRAGTSIGANLEEASAGQSGADFRSKLAISRKEAREARYWLRLMTHADRRLESTAAPLTDEAQQIVQILTTIKLNSEQNERRAKR